MQKKPDPMFPEDQGIRTLYEQITKFITLISSIKSSSINTCVDYIENNSMAIMKEGEERQQEIIVEFLQAIRKVSTDLDEIFGDGSESNFNPSDMKYLN